MILFMLIWSMFTTIIGIICAVQYVKWTDYRSEAYESYLACSLCAYLGLPAGVCATIVCFILLIS